MLNRRRPALFLRPDLTPFVSIALLLIVFFMWVQQLERPTASTLIVPPKHYVCVYAEPPKTEAILFLLAYNRIGIFRFGCDDGTAEFLETDYSPSGLRCFLQALKRPNHRVTLIIKPTDQATIGNLVYLLNELKNSDKLPFILSDVISPDETKLLACYSAYKSDGQLNPSRLTMPLYRKWVPPMLFLTPALPMRQWGY